ncbi:hypothetical protein SAMN05421847_1138 [Halpernia humi]|uniref:YD repeat-containing protein n=1 Tax=Halpernia humi TaxID=493375 RepID=A0A1H5W9K2_9FLAO|nr:hypothetical protein [Halpernia humi]SEF96060.1 hypothetical protein SAMN05421847_1138 [Halpernia humi]
MKKLISFFTLFAVLFVYNSCSPNADRDGDLLFGVQTPVDSGTTNPSGTIIKKVTTKDQNGVPSIISYTYTSNQLTSVSFGGIQNFDLTYTNGKITKIASTTNIGSITSVTNYKLNYTGNQLTSVDESQDIGTGVTQNSTSVISYINGKVSKIRRGNFDFQTPPQEQSYSSYDFTWNGNNLSTVTNTSAIVAVPVPPTSQTFTYSSYDSKKNPFNTLPIEFNIATIFSFNASLALQGFSANNPTKITSGTDSGTFTYTYNSDGFPTSVTENGQTSTYEYY